MIAGVFRHLIHRKYIGLDIFGEGPQMYVFSVHIIGTAGTISKIITVVQKIILHHLKGILSQKRPGNDEQTKGK